MTYNRWTTVHIPPHLRLQFWHEAVRAAQTPATVHIADPGQLDATLASRSMGAVVFNHVKVGAAHQVMRLRSDIEQSGPPSLLVYMYLKGSAQVSLSGAVAAMRRLHAQPGQPFLLDERRTFRLGHEGPVELLVLAVPLSLLDIREQALEAMLACDLPHSACLQLLMQQMQLLGQWTHELPAGEALHLSDLVAATLRAVLHTGIDAEAEARTGRTQRFLLRRVRQLIARLYPDPQLGPDAVARRLGVSVRTMQAHLAREGTSLSAELMAYRLERAHALLRGASHGEIAVMEVSQRCGFSSPAHFSRRFRARYGHPPVGVLKGLVGAPLQGGREPELAVRMAGTGWR